jgi:hypothetical protein
MPIARGPRRRGLWRSGRPLTVPVTTPLVYTLDPHYPGNPKAMYYGEVVPVMREDVIEALRKAGVDNIDLLRCDPRKPADGPTTAQLQGVQCHRRGVSGRHGRFRADGNVELNDGRCRFPCARTG